MQVMAGALGVLTRSSAATGFDFLSLNPLIYYDWTQGIDNPAGVATWSDLSGNGRNATQPTSSKRPTVSDGVVFDGVDDFLKTATFTAVTTGSLILKVKFVTLSVDATHDFVCNIGGTSGFYADKRTLASPHVYAYSPAITAPAAEGVVTILQYDFSSGSGVFYKDNVVVGSSSGWGSPTLLSLAASSSGTRPSQTNFYDVLLLPSIPDVSTRTQIYNNLIS